MTPLTQLLLAALALGSTVQAHVALQFPPPFNSKDNPNTDPAKIDYTPTAPLSGAAQFPCKGFHTGVTEKDSTATFTAGGQGNLTLTGSAIHGGGSCQVSLSFDKGTTFKVIHSYIGNCPSSPGEQLNFNVPSDTPSGLAIFSWSWNNKIGNREFYQGCSAVTIAGGSSAKAASVPFNDRPDIFVANLGNGCTTTEGVDPVYPNPGPSEDVTGSGTPGTGLSGSCGSATPPAAGSGDSSPASPAPPAQASSVFATGAPASPTQSAPGGTASSTAPASTATGAPSNLTPSSDGTCGAEAGHTCSPGNCCSASNFCGASPEHCGTGCQSAFGLCGTPKRASVKRSFVSTGRPFTIGVAGRVRV